MAQIMDDTSNLIYAISMNGLTRAVGLFSLVVVGMSDHAEEFV